MVWGVALMAVFIGIGVGRPRVSRPLGFLVLAAIATVLAGIYVNLGRV